MSTWNAGSPGAGQRTASAGASPAPSRSASNPRMGYVFAVLNMIISGVAIYVNSLGVKMFSDSTLYTTLKNAVVGVALLVPLALLSSSRAEYRRLTRNQWLLLLVVALIGGSVSYALDFRGLQLSTPVTASLIDHTQFLVVAVLAAFFLRERFGAGVWVALLVLFGSLCIGIKFNAVKLDAGVPFLVGATLLFAIDFVLMKYLLRSVSILTVMTFKMTLGATFLFMFLGLTGHLGAIRHLSTTQWSFVLVTGLILLAFTATSVMGLRHASATAVTSIPAAAPIVTTLLVVFSRNVAVSSTTWLELSLMLLAVLTIFVFGQRRELRAPRPQQSPRSEALA
jgi:drug/metabolite transporter (DMT)-like permease